MTFGRKPQQSRPPAVVDFHLPAELHVRAIDPGAADLEALLQMFGPGTPASDQPADVILRFTDKERDPREGTSPRTRLSVRKTPLSPRTETWAQIDLASPASERVIVYPRNAAILPLLKEFLAEVALRRGWVGLHASALTIGDTGLVLVGPAHTGKTGLLLSLLERGGRLIGDDCILVARGGGAICALERRVGISVRHLKELRSIQDRLSAPSLYALRAMAMLGAKGKVAVPADSICQPAAQRFRGNIVVLFMSESDVAEPDAEGYAFDSCTPEAAAARATDSSLEYRRALTRHTEVHSRSPQNGSAWLEQGVALRQDQLGAIFSRIPSFEFRRPRGMSSARSSSAVWNFVRGGCLPGSTLPVVHGSKVEAAL